MRIFKNKKFLIPTIASLLCGVVFLALGLSFLVQKRAEVINEPVQDKGDTYAVSAPPAGENWIDYAASSFASGSGTSADPFIISSAEELAYLAKTTNEQTAAPSQKYYQLSADIDLSGKYWTPIGDYNTNNAYFYGYLYGENHTISGMYIGGTIRYSGLFGRVTTAIIFNLTIDDSVVDVTNSAILYAGGLCGYKSSTLKAENFTETISVTASSTGGVVYAGGACGYGAAALTNATLNVTLSAESSGGIVYAGGNCGINFAACTNVTINGSISAETTGFHCYAGGFFGYGGSTLTNCVNNASVTSHSDTKIAYAGGFTGGSGSGGGNFSVNNGAVSAVSDQNEAYAGGVIAYTWGSGSSRYINKGNITATGGTIAGSGGIYGGYRYPGSFSSCENEGTITANSSQNAYAGGILGYFSYDSGAQAIGNCYNKGQIISNGNLIACSGGIFGGYGEKTGVSKIYRCFNMSSVDASSSAGTSYAGGIVGRQKKSNTGEIYDCFNFGDVSSNGQNATYAHIIAGETGIVSNTYWKPNIQVTSGASSSITTMTNSGVVSDLVDKVKNISILSDETFGTYTNGAVSGDAIWTEEWPLSVWDVDLSVCNHPYFFSSVTHETWLDYAASSFAGGSNTSADPYQISSAEELAYLSKLAKEGLLSTSSYFFKLTSDIDLSAHYWVPIGPQETNGYYISATGSMFDGDNHTITGMNVRGNYGGGVFGIYYGSVKNLTIDQSSINVSAGRTGAIAANGTYTNVTYSNISVNCQIKNSSGYAGGFMGEGSATFENCYNYGNVSGIQSVAGFLSWPWNGDIVFNNCANYGDISNYTSSGAVWAGGIVGMFGTGSSTKYSLGNVVNYGDITVQQNVYNGHMVGGLFGQAERINITAPVVNYGNIYCNIMNSGRDYQSGIGGIGGYASGVNSYSFRYASNFGNIEVYTGRVGESNPETRVGGILGRAGFKIDSCFNKGKIELYSDTNSSIVGGIVGRSGGVVSNCFNEGQIISTVNSGNANSYSTAGGIVGEEAANVSINNCYNLGEVVSSNSTRVSYSGGILGKGYSTGVDVRDCFNLGNVSSNGQTVYANGISPLCLSVSNSYYDSSISVTNGLTSVSNIISTGSVVNLDALMQDEQNFGKDSFGTYVGTDSGDAIWSEPWGFESAWYFDKTKSDYPIFFYLIDDIPMWTDHAANSFAGGDGTEVNPYLISNGAELAYLANLINSQATSTTIYCKLISDIDLSQYFWTPIGGNAGSSAVFKGCFNGNGHTISGLKVRGILANAGLFGRTSGVNLKDFVLEGYVTADSKTSCYAGGIIGYHYSGSAIIENVINNCNVTATTTSSGFLSVGGFIGNNNGNAVISNSQNNGFVKSCRDQSGNWYSGGFIGQSGKVKIENVINRGHIYTELGYSIGFYSGGIMGSGNGSIFNALNLGDVDGRMFGSLGGFSYIYLGGLVGCPGALDIGDCQNYGKVAFYNGKNLNIFSIGGIIGKVSGKTKMTSCLNFGDIYTDYSSTSSSYAYAAGGLIGSGAQLILIQNCFAKCNIETSNCAGGFIGNFNATSLELRIESSFFEGNITTTSRTSSNMYSVGGFVGYIRCKTSGSWIMDCYSKANIFVKSTLTNLTYIQNLIGYNDATYSITPSNYYYDVSIHSGYDSTNDVYGTVSQNKVYSGVFEENGETNWFFDSNFKGGQVTLKNIYWVGSGLNQTDEQIKDQLESLGFTELAA